MAARVLPKPASELFSDYANLQRLEKMAYALTDSGRPTRESRKVAKDAASQALETMRRVIDRAEGR